MSIKLLFFQTRRRPPLAPPTLSEVPGAAAFAPNPPMPQSFQPKLQYISTLSQYAPVRVTSTISGPAESKPVAPSALHALSALSAAQLAAHPPAVFVISATHPPLALPPLQALAALDAPLPLTPSALHAFAAFAAAQPAAQLHSISSAYACGAARVTCVRCGKARSAPAGCVSPTRSSCRHSTRCGPARSTLASRARSTRRSSQSENRRVR